MIDDDIVFNNERDPSGSDYTPEEAREELLRLITKAGRRCAYDLAHAVSSICDPADADLRKMYERRAQLWQSVFNPGCDQKNYRDRLHHKIDQMHEEIDRLQKLVTSLGGDPTNPDGFPF